MKILLVEDNKEISQNIIRLLQAYDDSLEVIPVYRWDEALKVFDSWDFDMLLLDLMLPWEDGISIAKKIRQKSKIPIIIISAKWEDEDKILWLEIGADDYIVKPFKVRELYARIKAVWRRFNPSQSERLPGNIEVDIKNKKVLKEWKEVKLKLKEFQILEYLIKHETVSRTDLLDSIWWEEAIFWDDSKLDVYISSLRKKLGKDVIRTIKGFWYTINKT